MKGHKRGKYAGNPGKIRKVRRGLKFEEKGWEIIMRKNQEDVVQGPGNDSEDGGAVEAELLGVIEVASLRG